MPASASAKSTPVRFLRTKLVAPTAGGLFIHRERLARGASLVRSCRITLVQAPAGYGKTSLLADWQRQLVTGGDSAAWLSIDSYEQTPSDLYVALIRSLENVGTPIDSLNDLLAADGFATVHALAVATSNLLMGMDRPVYLFFDDIHLLFGKPSEEALYDLLQQLPPNAHAILATRESPSLALGRLRARGELAEFGSHDLRFTPEEARELFAREGHAGLSIEDLDEISCRTEGWVSGLRLASIALRGASPGSLLQPQITGRERTIEALFAEEVLAKQAPDVQEFLLRTSPLSQFSADLADAVTGNTNGRQMIAAIEALGLFFFSLDSEGTWYRYHLLFSEFLARRLSQIDPTLASSICATASLWFEKQGNLNEAFNHALRADDPNRAAGILDRRCQGLLYSGDLGLFRGLVARFPEATVAEYPRILLTQAWLDTIMWRFSDAEISLSIARDRIEAIKRDGEADPAHLRELDYLYTHRDLMLALFTDRMEDALEKLRYLQSLTPHNDEYLLGTNITCDLYVRVNKFVRTAITDLSAQARVHYRRNGSTYVLIWHSSVEGIGYLRVGDLHRANLALEEALQIGRRIGGNGSGLAAIGGLLLAESYYLAGRRQEAAALLQEHSEAAAEIGYVDQLVSRLKVSLRISQAAGDKQAPERILAEHAALAATFGFERLRLAVAAEAARYQVREGRRDLAGRYTLPNDLEESLEQHAPFIGCDTTWELKATLAVRLAQASGSYGPAARLAMRWRDYAQRTGWLVPAIHWGILGSELEVLNGDRLRAYRSLRAVIEVARPTEVVAPFLDEGEIVLSVLREYAGTGTQTDEFIRQLLVRQDTILGNLAQCGTLGDPVDDPDLGAMIDVLTPKEVEILTGVGHGQINKEIARYLGLTEGSVKWYLNRIYRKIGVARRAQAVKRARQLGLIA